MRIIIEERPCEHCGIYFLPKGCGSLARDRRFCSLICVGKHNSRTFEPRLCERCGEPVRCTKSATRFCSVHCSMKARWENRPMPEPRPCKYCGTPVEAGMSPSGKSWRSPLRCPDCAKTEGFRGPKVFTRTKGQLFASRPTWQSARSSIRKHAERVVRHSGLALICRICGYDKYVEIAHRQSVSSFPDSALVSEINDLANLVLLCPNHHWEFDAGMLDL